MRFASHFSLRLLDKLDDLSGQSVPIAEINRRIGAEAQRLGVTKPSYERVRQLVHEARELHRGYVSGLELSIDAALTRSPRAVRRLATLPPRPRLRDNHRL